MSKRWQLQEAKSHFSELVDRVLEEGPQTVTRHGEPVVVIVPYSEFRKRGARKGNLIEFFQSSPLKGVQLDLTREETWDREL